ncbi:hypothetical protein QEN19_000757 [Hanseniaspora menglaensis]
MAEEKKLTKKQLKTLEFKKKRKADEIKTETIPEPAPSTIQTSEPVSLESATGEEPPKKKRKTRRGRKGRPRQGEKSLSARFILFVGNLPYSCTVPDLQKIFKTSKPDLVRLRPDKGIAFLEFHPQSHKDKLAGKEGEEDKVEIDGKEVTVDSANYSSEIQKRMDIALLQNGRMIETRKIKVELTVGGGGNSEERREKIGKKNDKMDIERTIRLNNLKKRAAVPNNNKRD